MRGSCWFSTDGSTHLSDRAPRLLFVPVSGAYGMGEYARSLAIAQGAKGRWPDASILFVLSRQAPYAASAPFPTALLDSSPTFHSAAVAALIEKWRPDAVLFDNAGRTAQLRAARRCGARVVYISARRRQRYKAFRLRWMRVIDEHWIAYPRFIAGDLTFLERLKLRYLRRPRVRFLDVVLDRRLPGAGRRRLDPRPARMRSRPLHARGPGRRHESPRNRGCHDGIRAGGARARLRRRGHGFRGPGAGGGRRRAAPAAAGLTHRRPRDQPHRPLRAVCASRARCRRATWRS